MNKLAPDYTRPSSQTTKKRRLLQPQLLFKKWPRVQWRFRDIINIQMNSSYYFNDCVILPIPAKIKYKNVQKLFTGYYIYFN